LPATFSVQKARLKKKPPQTAASAQIARCSRIIRLAKCTIAYKENRRHQL
jgi:hypothetical protein